MAILDSSQIAAIKLKLDEMISTVGKVCKLYYHSVNIDCENCVNQTQIGKKSKNAWRHGGPLPFSVQGCPICGGTGKMAQESTENITMVINWDTKSIVKNIAPNVIFPFSIIQTRGYIYDLPKVLKCEDMEVQLPMGHMVAAKYKLINSPTDAFSVIQEKYFLATWERIS